jgi:anaerobic ribonucleoside-triphosphate reductase activating protein
MQGRIARVCTSFIDVPGKIAVAIYFAGCSIRCADCQNKDLWDFSSGKKVGVDYVVASVEKHPLAEYAVFLGGEPTDQPIFLGQVCAAIKDKKKALYTGREFEDIPDTILDFINLVICGPYRSELHIGGWPASSNQRVFRKEHDRWIYQNTH